MACNNSSNIISSAAALTAVKNTSRLVITIPANISSLVGVGDVIRYDALNGYYVWSSANGIVDSEVVGIVESINPDNSRNVVVYGSINLPDNTLLFTDSTGGDGGNDVFFVSDTQPGRLQNIAPSGSNTVIKTVYQKAPHGSYTGIVVNNIGYARGGAITSQLTQTTSNLGTLYHYIAIGNNSDLQAHKVLSRTSTNGTYTPALDTTLYSRFYQKYGLIFGTIHYLTLESISPVQSTMVGQLLYKDSTASTADIIEADIPNNKLRVVRGTGPGYTNNELVTNYYWIQGGGIWLGNADFTQNASAYLQRLIYITVNSTETFLPTLTTYSSGAGATTFSDITGTKNFRTTNINNIGLNFIIDVNGQTSSLNVGANSFVEEARITTLTVNETDINQLILDLENRISYLESRLTM
jgi:hypothetical protein